MLTHPQSFQVVSFWSSIFCIVRLKQCYRCLSKRNKPVHVRIHRTLEIILFSLSLVFPGIEPFRLLSSQVTISIFRIASCCRVFRCCMESPQLGHEINFGWPTIWYVDLWIGFIGKILTINHGFYRQRKRCSVEFPLNQSNELSMNGLTRWGGLVITRCVMLSTIYI